MARFAVIAPPLGGHMDPLGALARALARRGHETLFFLGEGEAGPRGCRVRPVPLAKAGQRFDRLLAGASGLAGTLDTVRSMARRTEALVQALPAALVADDIDVVLADQTEAAGALAALRAGLPWVTIGCGLPLNRETGLPPPYVGWSFGDDFRTLSLNRGAERVIDWMMSPLSRAISRQAAAFGVGGINRLDDTFSPALQLFQMPVSLDFPRKAWPGHGHRLGPFRDGAPETWRPPRDDGRPLAFCSLGTLQGGRLSLFRIFASALAAQGFRPVIVHCGRLTAEQAAGLPGDPVVADFLPQRAVLARAKIAIVHGGLNTVLDALEAGVPMAVAPIAFEQGGIAARVEASGAGLAVSRHRLARQLPDAIKRLAAEPQFTERARQLSAEMRAAGGAERAAELLSGFAARHSRAS